MTVRSYSDGYQDGMNAQRKVQEMKGDHMHDGEYLPGDDLVSEEARRHEENNKALADWVAAQRRGKDRELLEQHDQEEDAFDAADGWRHFGFDAGKEPRPCTLKIEGLNPKDRLALDRVPLWALPAIGAIHGAQGNAYGLEKYGAYNWREKPIKLMEYLGAMERHIACLKDGQWRAEDSKVTHLGHIIATASIILDAEQVGTLIDDRPELPGKSHEELESYRDKRKA